MASPFHGVRWPVRFKQSREGIPISTVRFGQSINQFSGGELNYLKFLARHPRYMAICMFGFVFIVVGNSAANCVSFGVHILAAAGVDDPQKGAVQGIALGTAWLVTLLHALGRMFGIHLNSVFAVTKVSILILIIILGFIVLNNHTEHLHRDPLSYTNLNPNTSFKQLGTGDHARGFAAAYLNIIFTCGGWNQANYVNNLPSKLCGLANQDLGSR